MTTRTTEKPTKKIRRDALGHERRRFEIRDVEIRQAENDGDAIGFKGHAAVFNSKTWIGARDYGFWEQVSPGAFRKTISEHDIRFLIDHIPRLVLSRNKAGTLRLSEDDVGLLTDADMDPTSYARDLSISLANGTINQMSFSFEPIKEEWEVLDDGSELRTLKEVKLWDVSAVTYAAYEDTDASLRSLGLEILSERMGLDDEDLRARLLRGLSIGELDGELAATLRDAGTRLVNIAEQCEPAPATRTPGIDQPASTTGRSVAVARRRLRLKAAEHGLAA
jgi:HK97 family phage prohead protease